MEAPIVRSEPNRVSMADNGGCRCKNNLRDEGRGSGRALASSRAGTPGITGMGFGTYVPQEAIRYPPLWITEEWGT